MSYLELEAIPFGCVVVVVAAAGVEVVGALDVADGVAGNGGAEDWQIDGADASCLAPCSSDRGAPWHGSSPSRIPYVLE